MVAEDKPLPVAYGLPGVETVTVTLIAEDARVLIDFLEGVVIRGDVMAQPATLGNLMAVRQTVVDALRRERGQQGDGA